jgi:ribosome-associated protein
MLTITAHVQIPETELVESFVRSSGPGGQNVNKVATAVQLRFDVANSPSLSAEVKQRLTQLAGSRMTEAGVLVIEARRFRTQEKNREDARERLALLIRKALHKPTPRKPTRPGAAARQRRLDAKKQRGELKRSRHVDTRWED